MLFCLCVQDGESLKTALTRALGVVGMQSVFHFVFCSVLCWIWYHYYFTLSFSRYSEEAEVVVPGRTDQGPH